MSLFSVDGWVLPTQVRSDSGKNGKKSKKAKKKVEGAEEPVSTEAIESLYDKHVAHKDVPSKKRQAEQSTDAPKDTEKKRKKNKTDGGKRVNEDNAQEKKVKSDGPVLQQNRAASKPETKLTPLQQKMKEKLTGSRFRWINEQLYTTTSAEALKLFEENPNIFEEYHSGFRSQVKSWPENPVDTLFTQFKSRLEKPINAPGGLPGYGDGRVVVADMGCGEAQLARNLLTVKGNKKTKKLKMEVHSFDLHRANELITVADIRNVPLADESANVVVFCLALMGTNFLDFIKEAIRILRPRGEVWIAEIKSRFPDNDYSKFVDILKKLGLFHKTTDDSNKMFVRFEFFKPPKDIWEQRLKKQEQKTKFIEDEESHNGPEGEWLLKPCLYKRR